MLHMRLRRLISQRSLPVFLLETGTVLAPLTSNSP
jgi:hypothetical protein